MILEFSVKNFRSIRDLQTISFAATGLKSKDEELDKNNIVNIDGQRILKTIGIYGPNASGKSNVLRALQAFSGMVIFSNQPISQFSEIGYPFYYQANPEHTACFFQIILLINGHKYRYGYTVNNNNVADEWFFGPANDNQTYYFIREGSKDNLKVNNDFFNEGNNVPPLPYEHSLFLSHVASYQNGIAKKIWDFFRLIEGNILVRESLMRVATFLALEDPVTNLYITNLLKGFGFDYIKITTTEKAENFQKKKIDVLLEKSNLNGFHRELNLDIDESSGTRKMFDLIGLIARKSITGGFLILDELDGNFHPALVIKLIQLFNDPKINTGNAQLLFTSHDTNLLDPNLMRRDQFYFTEKTEDDATRLYSLADLKGIRNDADFARQYLAGYYGALPKLEDLKAEPKDE